MGRDADACGVEAAVDHYIDGWLAAQRRAGWSDRRLQRAAEALGRLAVAARPSPNDLRVYAALVRWVAAQPLT
jgi:hypothetical protein